MVYGPTDDTVSNTREQKDAFSADFGNVVSQVLSSDYLFVSMHVNAGTE